MSASGRRRAPARTRASSRKGGAPATERPPSQILVIFGATGDLTSRKIMPALFSLHRQDMLPEGFAVVGYSRTAIEDQEFREAARTAVEKTEEPPAPEEWEEFSRRLFYLHGRFDEDGCMAHLGERLRALDDELDTGGRHLYYCATPPSAFPLIVDRVGELGTSRESRIVVEKPFGSDLESARALDERIHRVFEEPRVLRIDHYLGKETVQNILVFRFANSMFERVWDRDAIDHVQITVSESVGVESRGASYEEAGAIRDMIQNHLLQMLAFLAMEPPRSLEAAAIHDEKVKVLRALKPFTSDDVVRGQYVTGATGPGYREEDGVAAGSKVETFAAVRARVDNWRWAGVPFYLRTGKRLPVRTTEVTVVFRDSPSYLFEEIGLPPPRADHLTIRIQPNEGISFSFEAKMPGRGFVPETVRMDFDYAEHFSEEPAPAYERLLHDAMAGDTTLFNRNDAVVRAWEVVAPILAEPGEVHPYEAGTWGPEAARALIAPREWHLR